MTTLQAIAYGSQVAAAVSAIMLTRRGPEHRPAAVALAILAAANILDAPTVAGLGPPTEEPIEGARRALVYLDGAINLGNDAIVAGLAVAVAVSPERRRRAVGVVAGVWLLASVALAAAYPSPMVRGVGLQRVYLAADLAGLFVATIATVSWARALIRAKRSPRSVHALALALPIFDAAILIAPFSPWRGFLFDAPYTGIQVIVTLFFAVITIVQVILWRFASS